MDQKETVETLTAAKQYLTNLQNLNNEINGAQKQINATYEETEAEIKYAFSVLKTRLMQVITNRQMELLLQAQKIRNSALDPLEECRNVILEKCDKTSSLLEIGNCILQGETEGLSKFNREASLLGSLPEVPDLKEVPYISFQKEASVERELVHICSEFGEITRIAPVQISQITAKPGALLVEWQTVDNDDKLADVQSFRLERAFGDVLKSKHLPNFSQCYEGLDTQFLVKDLQVNLPYSFRVCCKYEGANRWSPWSLPQVEKTDLKPFCWETTDGVVLTNENKIAQATCAPKILYSDGPQFSVGHSVEFTFLETDKSECILGLISTNSPESLKSPPENSFLLDQSGRIFVDGTEKSTVLSGFAKGLKVCFTCDLISDSKIRIHIDSNDKRVTYDWLMGVDTKMYFGVEFFSTKWKILVE